MSFKKFDANKRKWHLMPEYSLEEVLKVLEIGGQKYGEYNWLENAAEVDHSRYANALERHLKSYKKGALVDPETGLLEMAHIACNALMLAQLQLLKLGKDTRFFIKNSLENSTNTDKLNK